MNRYILICLCVYLCGSTNAWTQEKKETVRSPFVTCDMRGALGNQLLEIATTLAYAWDYAAIPLFPDLHRMDSFLNENRQKLFFRLDTSVCPRPVMATFSEQTWHSAEAIPFQRDQKLFGYLQSWRRFHHYRDLLLEIFVPTTDCLAHLEKKYADLLAHPYTVAVHVRTFNASLHASQLHPFLGLTYYQKAFDHFPDEALFVVFSDRIHWCEKHFSVLGKQFVYVQGQDAIEDLMLMTKMKHQIMANSTFSWWGAYLNQDPDKIVIAPRSWMHPELYPYPWDHPNDFYLPDWIMVEPDFSEPYPSDMTDYDITKSLDGW